MPIIDANSPVFTISITTIWQSLEAALLLWPDVAIKWDLSSIFMAGDPALRDRYLDGLRKAGMEG